MMKSKKIHKIVLKNPRLRRIRNNLRIMLKLAIEKELNRLDQLKGLYVFKNKLTNSQKKRRSQIWGEWNRLYHRYQRSTLVCGMGAACTALDEAIKHGFNPQDRPTDLDLVWVPWLRNWYCVDCFEDAKLGEMTHEDFDDPVTREWVKEEFGI